MHFWLIIFSTYDCNLGSLGHNSITSQGRPICIRKGGGRFRNWKYKYPLRKLKKIQIIGISSHSMLLTDVYLILSPKPREPRFSLLVWSGTRLSHWLLSRNPDSSARVPFSRSSKRQCTSRCAPFPFPCDGGSTRHRDEKASVIPGVRNADLCEKSWRYESCSLLLLFSSSVMADSETPQPAACQAPLSFPVHLAELAQNWVSGATQPSRPLSSPSPLAFSLSQHQGLFQSSLMQQNLLCPNW